MLREQTGARNGTFVNSRRLTPLQSVCLRSGDFLRFGNVRLRISCRSIGRLVDKQVSGREVREPEGGYVVHQLGQPEDVRPWSEEKTRNETDISRTRVRKTIEEKLADDPHAQKVFGELLKQAIAEAEAMFDHPGKQYALFRKFEERLDAPQTPGMPDRFETNRQAKACYGILRLILGDAAVDAMPDGAREQLVEQAFAIDRAVRDAVAENSLNPQSIEAAIRKKLLPDLFPAMGLDNARAVVEQVIQVTRVGLARG